MTTIKGGFKISKGKQIPKELLKYVKLPFKATGWKSEKNSEYVTGIKKPKVKPIEVKYTKDYLFALSKKEQIKILRELGVEKIPKTEKSRVNKIIKEGNK